MPDFHYAKAVTSDAQQHAESLTEWDQRYEQLSAGRFEGCLEEFQIGPIQIFREQANRTVLQQGRPRPDTVAIALTQAAGAQGAGWYCGHRLGGGRTITIASNSDFDLIAAAGMNLVAVCMNTSELMRKASLLGDGLPRFDWPSRFLLDEPSFDQVGLKGLLESAMCLARQQPALLETPAVRRMIADSLTNAMLACVALKPSHTELPPGIRARRKIISRARDHMQAHADEAITVPELCLATGVSRRALQYAFEDIFGISPTTYLRTMRLNRVRSELLGLCNESVGDIAARWGFWHMSRFAAEYRHLFGELPSVTRQHALSR